MSLPTPTPFKIAVPDETLSFITDRVRTARLPAELNHPEGKKWDYGIPLPTVTALRKYWAEEYDWRKVEERINSSFKMFTMPIEENGETLVMHFVHYRSARQDAVPLLFQHGWPGSFLEVENLLVPLTSPADPKSPAFHIVAPSLPGFTFSSSPTRPGFGIKQIASVDHKLMQALGYHTYIAQGGDWGSAVARALAIDYPDHCVGCHVNFIFALPPGLGNPLALLWLVLRWFTPYEKRALTRMRWWMKEECGYARIQGTKPQTLAYALTDSPVGLLAWIREKMEYLTDGYVWGDEEIITWIMMYAINSGSGNLNIYREALHNDVLINDILKKIVPQKVYFGVSNFAKDVNFIPQWWAKATVAQNIVLWKEHDVGGHFASVETPEVLVADICEFVEKIDGVAWKKLRAAGAVSK